MSVRREDASAGERSEASLGRWGRIAAAAAGATLLAVGLDRRSLGGAAAAAVGGWLLYRGIGGSDSLGRPFGVGTGSEDRAGGETATATVERSHAVTVRKPADELYERWRDPETQAQLFGEFVETTAIDEDRWRWEADGPFGRRLTWESRIVEDDPGELLRWESIDGAAVSAGGSVRFRSAPGDRGTEVTLRFSFDPPGGAVGGAVAERLGVVPETLALKVLRRFKGLAETGEIATLEKNPSGRGRGDLL